MTSPADPRGDHTQAPSIDGGTVKLLVGPKALPVTVHEELLRSRAAFFDAALNKCWAEGRSGQVMMPEDNPDIIKLYVQYLYTGKIYLERTTTSAKLKNSDNLPGYIVLAEAYVFGERIQDSTFKNSVVSAVPARATEVLDNTYWYPITNAVDIIYKGTMAGSLARRLMVELHVLRGGANFISEDHEMNNKEFLADLARTMLEAAREGRTATSPLAMRLTSLNVSKYHEKVRAASESTLEINLTDSRGEK
ncbi:hypothetical protein LTR15_009451 [Elasticomyces elasticus]|nr:hypothetical protein LTR15_009451 [Elasticomyces elasticus]